MEEQNGEQVILTVTRAAELKRLDDWIHDEFFELNEVNYDSKSSTLSIPFEREVLEEGQIIKRLFFLRKTRTPKRVFVLNIRNVTSYEIEDTEQIGNYDFESIDFNENSSQIVIKTNIPLIFRVTVRRLEIELLSLQNTTGFIDRWSI